MFACKTMYLILKLVSIHSRFMARPLLVWPVLPYAPVADDHMRIINS